MKIKIFRAWLVTKERFFEILTLIAMTISIKIFSSICNSYGHEMWKMDVKTVFLERKS